MPFLDVKVTRRSDNTLGHTVYRKPTHTDRYLHASSHHHPYHLRSVQTSLVNRARDLCDAEHFPQEMEHVNNVLRNNGYGKYHETRTRSNTDETQKPSRSRAFLPYVKGVTDRISKMLNKFDIKTIFKPTQNIARSLRPVKDVIPLQTPGVYKIECSCGLAYVGQTKRPIATRLMEHIKAVKNVQREKSAICEHILDSGSNHWVQFQNPTVLSKEQFYFPRMIREAIEIRRTPNFNRDDGYKLSTTWNPLLKMFSMPIAERKDVTQDTVSVVCRADFQNSRAPNPPPHHRYNLRSHSSSLPPTRRTTDDD